MLSQNIFFLVSSFSITRILAHVVSLDLQILDHSLRATESLPFRTGMRAAVLCRHKIITDTRSCLAPKMCCIVGHLVSLFSFAASFQVKRVKPWRYSPQGILVLSSPDSTLSSKWTQINQVKWRHWGVGHRIKLTFYYRCYLKEREREGECVILGFPLPRSVKREAGVEKPPKGWEAVERLLPRKHLNAFPCSIPLPGESMTLS